MTTPVALVTGGSRGIGLGIARRLARDGFNIAITGRRPESEQAGVLASLRDAGAVHAEYFASDVADLGAHGPLLDAIHERLGGLHVLVNNAGVAPTRRADILDASPDSFDRLVGINLRGPYFLTQRVAKRLLETRDDDASIHRCIVFVTSISATVVSTNRGDYCVSKAGLAMAAALYAARLGEHAVPVYEVRPGVIRTDMTAAVQEKYDRLFEQGLAVEPRWGAPDDVAAAVAALARGELPYATGQVLTIDGGLTMRRL